jgi:hypothetical protein
MQHKAVCYNALEATPICHCTEIETSVKFYLEDHHLDARVFRCT